MNPNFQKTVDQIEKSQKLAYIATAILISALAILWLIDIDRKLKSDRPSDQEVSDRLR